MHGQFCWYDLMTSDPAAAKRFYTSLFGWKTQEFSQADPSNPYTMWTVNGRMIGGVAKLTSDQTSHGVPPNWLPAVEVNDVDETARKATSLGARVVMGPMDIPNTGRYAIFTDPQGATLSIFHASGPFDGGYDGSPQTGRPSWHELMTTDFQKAADFYRQLFGWEVIKDNDMGPLGIYREFGKNGKSFGGMFNRPPEMAGMNPFWLPYVFVKDVKASTEAAKKLGARVKTGPMEVPGGDWIVVMGDPQNAAFAMHSRVAKAGTTKTGTTKTGTAKTGKSKPAKKKAAKKAKPKKKAAKKAKSKPRKKSAKKKSRRR